MPAQFFGCYTLMGYLPLASGGNKPGTQLKKSAIPSPTAKNYRPNGHRLGLGNLALKQLLIGGVG